MDALRDQAIATIQVDLVDEQADASAGGRIVSSLEGGYELQALARSVEAHLKSFFGDW